MKTQVITFISRVFSGIFILSSLLKAVNVFAFARTVKAFLELLGLIWLYNHSLLIAIFLCILEMLIGLLLLHKSYIRITTWACAIVMSYFTYITYINYTALYGQIESCGCFGEIIHLSATETLYKNIILLTISITLLINQIRTFGVNLSINTRSLYKHLCHPFLWGAIFTSMLIPISSAILIKQLAPRLFLTCYIVICLLAFVGLGCILYREHINNRDET